MAEISNSSLPTAALPASGLRGLRRRHRGIELSAYGSPALLFQNRSPAREVNVGKAARRICALLPKTPAARYSFFCAAPMAACLMFV
jgi:hypothetical protein